MSEKSQFQDVLIKSLIVLIFAGLYCLGGAEFGPGKWVRRYVATAIMVGGCYWFSRDWRSLVGFPLLIIGTSLGYGSDFLIWKIIKRLYCGLILGIGTTSGDWLNKRIFIALFLIAIVTIGMIVLGAYNILPNARTEEFFIGLLIALPIFSARRRA